MYQDLKQNFWWTRMKREIAQYVAECDTCQRVKASHLKVAGTLQPLPISSWIWEDIGMDFIVGLPNTSQNTILYGLLLIGLQRLLILFPYTPLIMLRDTLRYILIVLFVYMVYQGQLFLIAALSS
jgi:hypothetical protein